MKEMFIKFQRFAVAEIKPSLRADLCTSKEGN